MAQSAINIGFDNQIAQTILPMVESMGYELVRVKLSGGRRKTLQIMAERPDGTMNVEDCAELSGALSALLDVEDPIKGEYALEISSPGIDRPLVRQRDYERYAGHLAKIKLENALDGRKRFVGTLIAFEGDEVVIDMKEAAPDKKRVRLPFNEITESKLILTEQLIEESLKEGKKRTKN